MEQPNRKNVAGNYKQAYRTMKMVLFPIYFLSLIAMAISVTGCASLMPGGSADKAYELGEYHRAALLYKKSYRKEKNKYFKGEMAFKMGECYRFTNKPTKAATEYSRALRTSYKNPLIELYLAQTLLKMGKPEEARTRFQSYIDKYPTDPLGHIGLRSCDFTANPTKAKLFEVGTFKEINSKYSDYSPSYGGTEGEVVYFSSMRIAGKRKSLDRITGQGISKIYSLRKDSKGKWLKPEKMEDFGENTFDEGGICISADGKELYFTRCRFDHSKIMGAEIYVSKRTAGVWGEPQLIPLAGDSIVCAHPAISPDNLTLYFVSDMAGGIGGKDIWKVVRDTPDGEWGHPVNLGEPVNTKSDELFPSVDENGNLFFSSDGHPGLGGLDLFRLGKNDKDSAAVFNLGTPLNSISDDFEIVFKPKTKQGLFVSSRENVKGIDNIYTLSWRDVRLSVRGKVYDEKTKSPIQGAYVRLVSSDGIDKRLIPEHDGSFKSELLPKNEYVLLAVAPGYFNRKQKVSTPSLTDNDKEYVLDFSLSLKISPIVLENIYYAPMSWDLDNDAKMQMDRLTQLLTDNPSVRIEIASHTDASGSETDNIVLSQKRAQAIIDHLTQKGIATQRLSAKSFAGTLPLKVNKQLAAKYRFLKEGDLLDASFLNPLRTADRNTASKLNHRTEFKVVEQ
ncbi:MAG: OmpA family protein [Breznakibacter sp.]